MKTIYFAIILILISFQIDAQSQKVIDLKLKLLEADGIERVNILNRIVDDWVDSDPDSALKYADEALALAKAIKYSAGEGNAYSVRALALKELDRTDEAEISYNKSVELYRQSLNEKLNDSIKKHLKFSLATSYLNLGVINYDRGDYVLALKLYDMALAIREEYSDLYMMSIIHLNKGLVIDHQGNYDKALEEYKEALRIQEKDGNKKVVAALLMHSGKLYRKKGLYPQALDYMLKALKIAEEIGSKGQIASIYNSIAILLDDQENYEEALIYYNKSLQIKRELKESIGIANTLSNIGVLYKSQKKYNEAINYYNESMAIYNARDDKNGIGNVELNLANVYQAMGQFGEADIHYKIAMKISEELNDKEGLMSVYNNIGVNYFNLKRYDDAMIYSLKSLALAKEIDDKEGIRESYALLTDLDSASGNYSSSLANYKMYVAFRDSIFSEENTRKIVQLQMGYEFNKKEDSIRAAQEIRNALAKTEIELLNSENEIQRLKIKDREIELSKEKLLVSKRENDILILNQATEIKDLDISRKEQQLQNQALQALSRDNELKVLSQENELKEKEMSKQLIVRNGSLISLAVVLLFLFVLFNQKKRIGIEKQRSEDLLLNILPSETAEELKQTGEAKARSYNEVTVMFTDIRNFTSISERLSADELVKEINYYYSEFDKIIVKYGIEKIKTIGDSYMCAGGLPVETKTSALDTARAACAIRNFMHETKIERTNANLPFFEIRIGIHTGPVVAGIVGIKKFAYDIWGDTVNIASRMEGSGEVGKINISETTYILIRSNFKCVPRGKVFAKNKGEIEMFFLENEIA